MFISVFLLILAGASAQAAPCCAGSSALPALITGDEARKLSLAFSYGKIIGDAPGAGGGTPIFRNTDESSETKTVFTLGYASLIDRDRLQLGFSVPFILNGVSNDRTSSSNSGIGDTALTAGYEVLPELEYSVLKPRVFGFLQTVFPTGKSIFESTNRYATDVSGQGFYQFLLGGVAVKQWSNWDASASLKTGKMFGRTFQETEYGDTWILTGALNAGYSFSDRWRAGLGLEPFYQSPQTSQFSGLQSTGSQKLVWNTTASLTLLAGLDTSIAVTYVDQTLFGPAISTSLSRSVALSYQLRWER